MNKTKSKITTYGESIGGPAWCRVEMFAGGSRTLLTLKII